MVKNTRGRIAVPLAAALALLTTPLIASGAAAADPPAPPATIDSTHARSLTITKLAATEVPGAPADGSVLDHQGFPIKGVAFTIELVPGIDLTQSAGWEAAAEMDVDAARDAIDAADDASRLKRSGTTDEKGELRFVGSAPFEDLPLGVYLVTETGNSSSSSSVTLDGNLMKFLVTLPLPDLDNGGWVYDVNVYPKNTANFMVKEVRDSDPYFEDRLVHYDVRIEVPKSATKVELSDTFDPLLSVDWSTLETGAGWGHLSHPSWSAESSPKPNDTRPQEATFGTAKLTDRTLTVVFSEDEIADRFSDQTGETMVFRFSVNARAIGTGMIENDASYIVTSPAGTYTGDSSPVYTKWGKLVVTKTSESGSLLPGAVFEVYKDSDVEDGALKNGATPLATERTDDSGIATFLLRYSDWADGGGTEGNPGKGDVTYWAVEKTPPAGYKVGPDNKPRQFRITNRDNAVVTMEYVNSQREGFELPSIGGNRAILPILATLVVAGGVVWLVRSRRVND
ncbi:SpaH/EbpB family LPXTG-anchored major pilin [Xylanimonas protaetiae]|uniref:Uncharacterized protein n=1 Tax=Xylanimonas protaetiae TaxID=2509457 RepID=A0A4P6FK41_9MICO|nr:SpaH/EbpB family LPXTG-anchored major pilin [Xylanimonas protaetiae]QAY70988.1 hypothetical protein ET471_13915 [Xylanimonas protaetiae]